MKEIIKRLFHDPEVQQISAVGTGGGAVAYYVETVLGITISIVTLTFISFRAIREYRKLKKGE